MFKMTLTASTLALFLLSGCSSSNDPKDLAIDLCEFSKQGDITGIKAHASDGLKQQLSQVEAMINVAKSSDEGKKIFEQQIAKFASVKCEETTQLTKNEDGSFRVTNAAVQQSYTLKMVDGSWKMFQ